MEKEKQIYEDPKVLNVATMLAKRCLENEDMLFLLFFSIIIKHNSLDGRLTNLKVSFVRDLCGCSKKTACRILDLAKKNKYFFHYDEKNEILTARNINKPYTKKLIHPIHGEIWRIDVIRILRYNEDNKIRLTFRYLKKELKKLLLERGIKLCENYKYHFHESSIKVAFKNKCGIYNTNLFFPSHKQMCKYIGVTNKKHVSRLLKEMMSEGRITKAERCQLYYIGNFHNDGTKEMERRCKLYHTIVVDKHTGSAYAASPNIYFTIKRKYSASRNIILNHQDRMTEYYKKSEAEKAKMEMAAKRFAQMYDTCCDDE
jgi:hypothetical protein